MLRKGLQLITASREPVRAEEFTQGGCGLALDAEMFVAPEAVATTINVARGDIDAADVGYAAIDNDYLAVIAAVELRAQKGKTRSPPRSHLHTALTKLLNLKPRQGE